MTEPPTLAPRQQRFVEEYLIDLNGKQAAIRAGYAPRSAEVTASQLLSTPKVAAVVEARRRELAARAQVKQEDIVAELKRIAFSDMRSFAEWGPDGVTLRDSSQITEDATACVAEVSESVSEKSRSVRFKLHDKVGALEKLARHLGMLTDRVDVTSGGRPLLIVGDV